VATAFQPNAFQSNAFQEHGGLVSSNVIVQINATQGNDTGHLDIHIFVPAVFVHGGGGGEKKRKIHRKEVREAVLLAFDGPAKDEARELLIPFAKFAEVSPYTIDFKRLENDVDTVRRLVELVSFDEDDDEFLLML
jgi:hypothetical protein